MHTPLAAHAEGLEWLGFMVKAFWGEALDQEARQHDAGRQVAMPRWCDCAIVRQRFAGTKVPRLALRVLAQ